MLKTGGDPAMSILNPAFRGNRLVLWRDRRRWEKEHAKEHIDQLLQYPMALIHMLRESPTLVFRRAANGSVETSANAWDFNRGNHDACSRRTVVWNNRIVRGKHYTASEVSKKSTGKRPPWINRASDV
jgi:hypothetical protein